MDIDTNRYSVPWRYIGTDARVHVTDSEIVIYDCATGGVLATHSVKSGRRQVSVIPGHLKGIISDRLETPPPHSERIDNKLQPGALERPLSVYEEAVSMT
ncbi:hypothetical protein AGMMS50276_32510 [Synergistales bacterium]|nr:hypothetical protein AGMMS50276_32510 [Synergistales bacterium]